MGGAALTVGLSISVIGRKMPTLFGGNIMLSLFLGVLMRTSQGNHSDIPQWVFWPPIVWLATFTCMSGCICGAQECLLAILTGIVFSAIGLAIVVAAELKPIPWGLSAAIALFGFGLVAGLNYVEKLWLHKALSAGIGGFLMTDGAIWFVRGRYMAIDLAKALIQSGRS